jgi:predicted dehydrogenase
MSYQRDFETRLRIGVVGLGSHCYRNILPTLHHLPVDLVAMCDINESVLERTAREYGVLQTFTDTKQMYAEAELDAVLIVVSPKLHPDLAIEAMSHGLHVWMEKPPGMRLSDIDRMIANRGDRICAVGFKKAYMPATRKAHQLLSQPEFGALRSIMALYPMTIPRDGQAVLDSGNFINWLANGCHPLSLIISLGGPVEHVTTLRGPGDDPVGAVVLQFANGAVGNFHLAGGSPRAQAMERYEIFGDGKSITIDNSAKVTYNRGIDFNYAQTSDFTGASNETGSVTWEVSHMLATLENKSLFIQGFSNELLDFCTAILGNTPLRIGDLEFARQIMGVYEAALLSDGNPVALHSPRQ